MLKNLFKLKLNYLKPIKSQVFVNYRHYAALPKRFYKHTDVIHSGDGKFEITLDNRKLKTPQGTPFIVESEPLAIAVATEWNAQNEKIDRSAMHLTSLCSTAIDNPNHLSKEDIVNHILNFLPTDTILFQSKDEEDLFKMQCSEWDPIIDWFNQKYETKITKSCDISLPVMDPDTKMKISKQLMSYNLNAMHGFVFAVDVLKSPILAFACIDRHCSIERAVRLGRLEEEFQIRYWGRVEWSHDLSEQDSCARLAAAVLFVHMHSSQSLIKKKIV